MRVKKIAIKTWQYGFNFNLIKKITYSAEHGLSSVPENCAIQGGTWTLPFKARWVGGVLVCHPQQTDKQMFNL